MNISPFSEVSCPEEDPPKYTSKTMVKAEYGAVVTLTCDQGYEFDKGITSVTSQCTQYGNWSEMRLHCQGKRNKLHTYYVVLWPVFKHAIYTIIASWKSHSN